MYIILILKISNDADYKAEILEEVKLVENQLEMLKEILVSNQSVQENKAVEVENYSKKDLKMQCKINQQKISKLLQDENDSELNSRLLELNEKLVAVLDGKIEPQSHGPIHLTGNLIDFD